MFSVSLNVLIGEVRGTMSQTLSLTTRQGGFAKRLIPQLIAVSLLLISASMLPGLKQGRGLSEARGSRIATGPGASRDLVTYLGTYIGAIPTLPEVGNYY